MSTQLPVWTYWDGPRPPVVELCLETLRRHEPEARLLDRRAWLELAAPDEAPTGHLLPAHQADYARLVLLERYGGLWIDADCIVMRPLGELLDALRAFDFVSYRQRPGGLLKNSVMGSRPGGRVVTRALALARRRLREGRPLLWTELGERLLLQAVRSLPGVPVKAFPAWRFKMISDRGMRRYLGRAADEDHEDHWNPNAFCYHLTHKPVGWVADLTREDLLGSPLYLSFLLRSALGLKGPPGWRRMLERLPREPFTLAVVAPRSSVGVRLLAQQRPRMAVVVVDAGPDPLLRIRLRFAGERVRFVAMGDEWSADAAVVAAEDVARCREGLAGHLRPEASVWTIEDAAADSALGRRAS